MAVEHVAERVYERNPGDEIQDAGAEGDVGGGAKAKQAVGGGQHSRHERAHHKYQAYVDVPLGHGLFEREARKSCDKHHSHGHEVAPEQPAERRVGQRGQHQHCPRIASGRCHNLAEAAHHANEINLAVGIVPAEAAQAGVDVKTHGALGSGDQLGGAVAGGAVAHAHMDMAWQNRQLHRHAGTFGHARHIFLEADAGGSAAEQTRGIFREKIAELPGGWIRCRRSHS